MRLLLDGQLSPQIAKQLRDRGHDVVAAADIGLRGATDQRVLEVAAREGRALVTNDVGDFTARGRDWQAAGRRHHGLVFADDRSMPRSDFGPWVRELEHLLERHPQPGPLAGGITWLPRRA